MTQFLKIQELLSQSPNNFIENQKREKNKSAFLAVIELVEEKISTNK